MQCGQPGIKPPTHPTKLASFATCLGNTYRSIPIGEPHRPALSAKADRPGGAYRSGLEARGPVGKAHRQGVLEQGYHWRVCAGTLGGPIGWLWVASSYGVWVLRT